MQGFRTHIYTTSFALVCPLIAFAGGLRVPVDNGLGIPGAAGGAALAIDASTGITNPAGLVRIQNPELVVGVDPAFTTTRFEGTVSVENYAATPYPYEVSGKATGKLNAPLISIHFSFPLRDFLVYGFSFNNPFGQSANFPEASIVNSTLTEAMLITWNIANSLGYVIDKNWSIGAGFDVQRLDFVNENIFPALLNTRPEFYTKNEASDWAYGWHGGVLYMSDNEDIRVGFNYRSQIDHDASGKSFSTMSTDIVGPIPMPIPVGGQITNRNFSVSLSLPPIYSLSGFYRVSDKWDVMATVDFNQWNVYDSLEFTNVVNVGDMTVVQDYHNTWTGTVGTYYHFNPDLYLGLGLRYDETPMNPDYRGVEYPDSDVWVLGFSGGYQFNEVVRLELGYAHSFFQSVDIDTLDPYSSVSNVGEGQLYADVINTQLTINLAPVYGKMIQP